MNQLKWIQTSLLLTALLQFAAAARYKRVTFRVGEDATLPCEAVIQDQQKCEYTTWLFDLRNPTVELVKLGQVRNSSDVHSDRLRVTEDCSLVIKKITEEDDGRYACQQFKGEGGPRTGEDSTVYLLVIESEDTGPPPRPPTTRPPTRPPTTRPPTRQPTTRPPTRPPTTRPQTKPPSPTSPSPPTPTRGPLPRPSTTTTPATAGDLKWLSVLVPVVVFTALFVVIMKVIRRKGNRTQTSDDVELTSDPAGSRSAAGTNQDTADPEGGVFYASIRYKKGRSEAQVCGKEDDDDGSVTYASVKPSSSSSAAAAAAGSSADPSGLYATINKQKK